MFIDAVDLQNKIIENPEHIITVLESLGHTDIKDRGKYYQCKNIDGDNATAISILKSNLKYQNFSHGASGNLFTMVSDEKHCSFASALEYIAKVTGIDKKSYQKSNIIAPFGGFYKAIIKAQRHPESTMKIYSDTNLPDAQNLSYKWLLEGVDLLTQEQWGIRLDFETNAIIIPWFNVNGQLVGAKARSNEPDCPMDKRWYAYLPFMKTYCCYGMFQNYNSIIKNDTVVIFEAEKSVLQAASMGYYNCIAIGGHSISETQVRLIKSLMVSNIIVAFDEGITDEESKYEAQKLIMDSRIMKNHVGFIRDDEGLARVMGSKDSPTDEGSEIYNKLLKEFVEWL